MNGLLYKDARKQLRAFTEFTEINHVLLLNAPAAGKAAEIYAELKRQGKPIGHTDSLIAGIAMVNNLQLITNNTKHFERVKYLSIANWTL